LDAATSESGPLAQAVNNAAASMSDKMQGARISNLLVPS
jgi:hypothetical protein